MAAAAPRPWIVKIGGSLAAGPAALGRWLLALEAGRRRVVVVPGGGPFADTVRSAQAELGFDDSTAHRMALLAMEQYGMALCALGTPFLLRSWWAWPAAAAVVASIAVRTALEDRMLRDGLPGYREYAARVRHRLVPGAW